MQFNDTTNKSGIIQELERMTDLGDTAISDNSDRLKEFTAIVNRVQHRVWHLIFTSTGLWKYDDSNRTTMPFATTALEKSKKRYTLPESALTIGRVEVKDQDDKWYKVYPLIQKHIVDGMEEFMENDGYPHYYRLVGNVIELFPAPDYDKAAALKIFFKRTSVDFSSSDTDTSPGFASAYHEIIPIKAAIEWLKIKQPTSPTLQVLREDDLRLEEAIQRYYSYRFEDYTPVITRRKEPWK